MKKGIKLTVVLLLSLFLASCIETQNIEDLGIVNAVGVDSTENGLLELSLVVFQFTIQSEETSQIISGKGKTVEGAVEDAQGATLYKLGPGKIKLTVYGKEMAEKGILPLLDTDARDARVPDLMYLGVSKTTTKELFSIDEGLNTDVGQYLHGLIENHSRDHNIPRKTLQDFLRIYYDVGHDNVLPLFEIQEGLPKLGGMALFKGDRMVGELTNKDAVFINLMGRTVKEQLLELSLPLEPFKRHLEYQEDRTPEEEVHATFYIGKGKSKTKMTDEDGLAFQTDTTIELRLLEQSAGILLDDTHVVQLLEKEVEKEMENHFEKLLTKLQEFEADPYGYGRYYKKTRQGKDMTNEEWREKYPSIDVVFNVDAKIIRHGVTD